MALVEDERGHDRELEAVAMSLVTEPSSQLPTAFLAVPEVARRPLQAAWLLSR